MRKYLLLLLTFVLLFASYAVAQDGCVSLRGLAQAQLGLEHPINAWDYWGGPTFVFFGNEFLSGFSSGRDGTDYWRGPGMHTPEGGTIGQGKGGSYNFGFNFDHYENEEITVDDQGTKITIVKAVYKDSFTTYVTNAVFPLAPGMKGVGWYQASHKIVSGSGRFKNATGTLLISGTFLVGVDQDGNFYGRWNPDIAGKLCGITP